jgi:murein DD-endopeptidase MepM/ murein hydrolase activator NlpD
MAIQALIQAGDTIRVSKSFGIVGSAVITGSKVPVVVVAANNNEPITPQEMNINKPLVKMINALASIDGMIKQRLENQKIIGANQRLAQRESQIEQQKAEPQIEVIRPDAERVSGSSAGLFAVGGLLLLTLDPVQEAIKDLFDGVVSMGRFVTGVIGSINDAFKFLVGDSGPTSEVPAEAAPVAPREGGIGTTPAAEPVQGTPPTPVPATPDTTPAAQESPSFMGSVASGALTGGAIGMLGGRRGSAIGTVVGAAVGAYNYATGGSSSSASPAAGASSGGASSVSTSGPAGQENTKMQKQSGPIGAFGSNFKDPVPGGSWSGPGLGLPRDGGRRRHQGIDIFATTGTPVYASADGEVVYSERRPTGGFGNAVQLKHSDGYITKYAHLNSLAGYAPGDTVRAGDVIGYVGDTGNAKGTPPHLHYEIWRNGSMQEPANYLSGGGGGGGQDGYAQGGASTLGQTVSQAASQSLEQMGKLLGAIGGALVAPGIPRTDTASIISSAASEYSGEVAANKTETPPSPPAPPAPPRINVTEGGAVQNPATSADRNSVYYYLRRFGFQDLSTPESALQPAS